MATQNSTEAEAQVEAKPKRKASLGVSFAALLALKGGPEKVWERALTGKPTKAQLQAKYQQAYKERQLSKGVWKLKAEPEEQKAREQYEKAFHGAKGNNLVAGFRDCGLVPPSFEKLWDKTEEFRAQKERENDDALARALEFPKTPSPAPPVLATRDCQTNPRELERRPLSATRADLTQPKATRAAPKRKRAEEVDSDSDSTEQLSEPSEVELETGYLVEGSAAKLPQGPTSCPENFNWRAWVRKRRETRPSEQKKEGACATACTPDKAAGGPSVKSAAAGSLTAVEGSPRRPTSPAWTRGRSGCAATAPPCTKMLVGV